MVMRLTDKADMGIIFDSEVLRYGEKIAKFNITREQFIKITDPLPSIGFEKDGKIFGGAFFLDHQIHLSVLPEFHSKWGTLVRPMLEWMFRIEDPVLIKIEKDNEKCIHFAERCNFQRAGSDETYVFFKAASEMLKPSGKRNRS